MLRTTKVARNDKEAAKELELLNRIKAHLEDNRLAKSFEAESDEEQELIDSYNLLTAKPVILQQMYARMTWQMMVLRMQECRQYESMQHKKALKYLLYVLRLSRKSQNWMMKRRRCS